MERFCDCWPSGGPGTGSRAARVTAVTLSSRATPSSDSPRRRRRIGLRLPPRREAAGLQSPVNAHGRRCVGRGLPLFLALAHDYLLDHHHAPSEVSNEIQGQRTIAIHGENSLPMVGSERSTVSRMDSVIDLRREELVGWYDSIDRLRVGGVLSGLQQAGRS
jgi:hypothetical protein